MNYIDWIYVIVLVILIMISALCSATETALSSCNVIRVKSMAKKGNKKAKNAYKLIRKYSNTLTTILVFNNVVNTASASLATYVISSKVGASGIVYATIIMTIFILLFGEITPKIIAKENAEAILLKTAPIFMCLTIVIKPIVFFVSKMEQLFKRKGKKITATEDELLEIVQTIEFEGVLNQGERELIQNAVVFDDKKVKDVMINRNDVVVLYDTSSSLELKKMLIEKKFSRIPVVCEKTGQVLGIIHEGDYIDNYLSGKEIIIHELLKEPLFLSKNRRLPYALERIQKERMHMAIVVDNNDNHTFLGIVTLEDILEELVGEIYDEYDEIPKNVVEIGLHTYLVDPNVSIRGFFEEYLDDIELPKTKSKTLMGWINEMSDGKMKLNHEFSYLNIRIKIVEITAGVPSKLEIVVGSTFDTF